MLIVSIMIISTASLDCQLRAQEREGCAGTMVQCARCQNVIYLFTLLPTPLLATSLKAQNVVRSAIDEICSYFCLCAQLECRKKKEDR